MNTPRRVLFVSVLLLAWLVHTAAFAAELAVHFFDVGQGDSALIVSPAGKTVLIDAGPPEAAEALAQRLKGMLNGPIDLMIMTHPHADHLGGMEAVLEAVGTRLFMDPGFDHPSPMYTHLLEALERKGVPLKLGEAGRNVELGGGATLRLIAPSKPFVSGSRSDVNANSIVARLTYGTTSFYFSGDSERETEQRVLSSGETLASNVYKVAHHASRHSSTPELLAKVAPEIAVVSVGANNSYGHPTREALDRLESVKARVYRTDLDGEIVIRSDGQRLRVTTGGEARPLVASREPVAMAAATPAKGRNGKEPAHARVTEPAPEPTRPAAAREPAVRKPDPEPDDAAVVAPPARDPVRTRGGAEEGGTREPKQAEPRHASPDRTAGEQAATSAGGYIGSRSSDVFHSADCGKAGRIKPDNIVRFATRQEAIDAGRRPAKDCNP